MASDRLEVRAFVRHLENVICNPASRLELLKSLTNVIKFINNGILNTDDGTSEFSNTKNARQIFLDEFYEIVLKKVLDQMSLEWISKFQCDELEECIDKLFFEGNNKAVFVVLNNSIDNFR